MISTYQRLKRRRDAGEINGFTLIELLIVIVVLGILAAVVIFALGGITGKSQVAACQADGATVSTALSAFHAQNPTVLTADVTTGDLINTAGDLGGPYIQSWPSANQKTNGYNYTLVAGVLTVTTANGFTSASDNVSIAKLTPTAYTTPADCGGA